MQQAGEFLGTKLMGYSLETFLGAGSLGEVYRAVHPALAQPVALKILGPEVTRVEAGQRLRVELSRVASLYHPGIVRVFGIDSYEDHLVISMALGQNSLADYLARQSDLPLDWCVRQVLRTAAGLQAALEIGLVHGDLKPTNILLDSLSRALVTDYGQSHLTQHLAQPIQTYCAPEVLAGQAPTARSDVFSLGVIFYQLITGIMPSTQHVGDTGRVQYRRPSSVNSMLGEAIDYVIFNALAPSPGDRYPDALGFSRDLYAAQAPQEYGLQETGHLRPAVRPSGSITTIPLFPEGKDLIRHAQAVEDPTITLRIGELQAVPKRQHGATRRPKQVVESALSRSEPDFGEVQVPSQITGTSVPAFRLVPVSLNRRESRLRARRPRRAALWVIILLLLVLITMLGIAVWFFVARPITTIDIFCQRHYI